LAKAKNGNSANLQAEQPFKNTTKSGVGQVYLPQMQVNPRLFHNRSLNKWSDTPSQFANSEQIRLNQLLDLF
jgi:hypothetical protein